MDIAINSELLELDDIKIEYVDTNEDNVVYPQLNDSQIKREDQTDADGGFLQLPVEVKHELNESEIKIEHFDPQSIFSTRPIQSVALKKAYECHRCKHCTLNVNDLQKHMLEHSFPIDRRKKLTLDSVITTSDKPDLKSGVFLTIGNRYTKPGTSKSKYKSLRKFKVYFGVTPEICSIIWQKIKDKVPVGGEPKHLLWTLHFFKKYSNEHIRRSFLNADEKTIRKWTWIFVKLLSELNVVLEYSYAFKCPK